ncbi:hypothetical protein ES703_65125 [subsurface metagenome]
MGKRRNRDPLWTIAPAGNHDRLAQKNIYVIPVFFIQPDHDRILFLSFFELGDFCPVDGGAQAHPHFSCGDAQPVRLISIDDEDELRLADLHAGFQFLDSTYVQRLDELLQSIRYADQLINIISADFYVDRHPGRRTHHFPVNADFGSCDSSQSSTQLHEILARRYPGPVFKLNEGYGHPGQFILSETLKHSTSRVSSHIGDHGFHIRIVAADNSENLFFDLFADIVRHLDMCAFGHSDVHVQVVRVSTGEKHHPRHPKTQKDERQEEKNDSPGDNAIRAFSPEEKSQSFPVTILHSGKYLLLEFGDQEAKRVLGYEKDDDPEHQEIGRKHLTGGIENHDQDSPRQEDEDIFTAEFPPRSRCLFPGGSLHERNRKDRIDHVGDQQRRRQCDDDSDGQKGHEFARNSRHKNKREEGSHGGQRARENGYSHLSDSTFGGSGDG